MPSTVTSGSFGKTKSGADATLFRITNASGAYVEVTNYGCIVKRICVRDGEGSLRSVILGYDTLAEYESADIPMGFLLGRCAGIAAGRDFMHKVWKISEIGKNFVLFSRTSPDGEDGCAGSLDVSVRMMWVDYDRLVFDITAAAGIDMPVDLTSCLYFHLDGCAGLDTHRLRVFCEKMAVKNANGSLTGEMITLDGTDYAQSQFNTLGTSWCDETFVSGCRDIHPMAELYSVKSKIALSAYTTMPALHFCTVNKPSAAAMLTQGYFPSDGRLPEIPSMMLKAGETRTERMIYGFDNV